MENSIIQQICQNLICSAIQRCRKSENPCVLSILLKISPDSDNQIIQISNTGVGSSLVEFQDLHCKGNQICGDKWDGAIDITTTSFGDEEIYHYKLNSKKRLIRLPSTPKNGVKFSGTEVSLSTTESIDNLVQGITCFLKMVIILKIDKVAVELLVACTTGPKPSCETLFLASGDIPVPYPMSNVERLIFGFEDHVLKHGSKLDEECKSCFTSRDYLKVGSGVANSTETLRNTGEVLEAVIIITELPEEPSPSCLITRGTTTKSALRYAIVSILQVLFFQDFAPSSIPLIPMNALTSIDWKSYGLSLKANAPDGEGQLVLEWENLPPFTHVDIAIHSYHIKIMFPQAQPKSYSERKLLKKALKLALDDMKERFPGVLLSAHALKIRNYAPDLAKSIAGLVLSSSDLDFLGECNSLLGLHSQEIDEQNFENHIRDKITKVIEMNDRKLQKSKESAPFLFGDDSIHEEGFHEKEEDGGFNIKRNERIFNDERKNLA
ncbi:type 2 DNA topoisomerase 6 subunit B-like isoform X3 [Papaver somniferum]|uniref:type 2 DNA topoisomerase 6 subunit B-like isoform X3 n=1 Tax=Papaver somniferum TaxID=3469 RepID=UPI000E7016AA|nr:type 2 DNA topoisomerase 6 subunit B-like isoform X3 [Papaver somniferum]